jgi:hypothetical protein
MKITLRKKEIDEHLGHMAVLYIQSLLSYKDDITAHETLYCILSIKQDLCCRFFEIFEKYDGYKDGHVKLKRPKQLQEILDIARSLLNEIQHRAADPEIEEKQGKLEQLKSVLEM